MTACAPVPEGLREWIGGAAEAWADLWTERVAIEIRDFTTIPRGELRARVRNHAGALVRLLGEGDADPLRDFYERRVWECREFGLGLPDRVAALILGRGLLKRMAREAAGDSSAAWDEAIAETFDTALTLLVRRHEEAVEESVRHEIEATEGRLLAILRGSTDGLVVLDPDGRVALWNRGASDLLGVEPGDAVGRPIGESIPPEVIHELPDAPPVSGGTRRFEARIPKERGGSLDLLVTRTEVPSPGGGPGWASLVFKDVTQVKALQRELAQSEHLAGLGRLSASVAHEIKNPIAGLRGAMEVISQVHRSDDPRFLIFQEALTQIRRLDTLVKDLLAYARPVSLNLEPISVEFLVEAALPLVREQIAEAKVDFRIELPPGLPCVLADPQHIPQVFSNLFQNGAQAMGPGGVLTVSAEPLDGEVVVRVRDTGCGIPQEHLSKIFQPFFTTKHIGTGLGLSIVQRILGAHGGRCEVAAAPGGGALFSVFLKAAPREPGEIPGAEGIRGGSRGPCGGTSPGGA